jgi:tetratricopeptide (TPR) repeat protein
MGKTRKSDFVQNLFLQIKEASTLNEDDFNTFILEVCDQANRLRRAERYIEAYNFLMEVAKNKRVKDSVKASSMIRAGLCLRTAGCYARAISLFDSVHKKYPMQHKECAISLKELGHTLRASGQFKKTKKTFIQVLRGYPEEREQCAETLRYLGHAYLAQGLIEDAVRSYNQILGEYPESRTQCSAALRSLGHAYFVAFNFDKSKEMCSRTVLEYPEQHDQCAGSLRVLGNCFRFGGNTEKAVGIYSQAIDGYSGLNIECTFLKLAMGKTYLQQKNYEAAFSCFAYINENDPQLHNFCIEAKLGIVDGYLLRYKIPEAVAVCNEIIRHAVQPSMKAETIVALAYCFLLKHENQKARTMFLRALDHSKSSRSQYAKALFGLATLYRREGSDDIAIRLYNQILNSFRESPPALGAYAWKGLYSLKYKLRKSGHFFTKDLNSLLAGITGIGSEYDGWEYAVALKFQLMALNCISIGRDGKEKNPSRYGIGSKFLESGEISSNLAEAMRRAYKMEWKMDFQEMLDFRAAYDEEWKQYADMVRNCEKDLIKC